MIFLYYFPLRRVSSSSGYSTVSVYFAIVTYSIIYYVTMYVLEKVLLSIFLCVSFFFITERIVSNYF